MPERPDRALAAWGASLRHDRAQRRCLLVRFGLIATVAVPVLATVMLPPRPVLAWNVSASMPVGLYGVAPGGSARLGDLVVARLPIAMRGLAAARHYLPRGVPLVKDVAAIAGQRVCARGVIVTVDGAIVALRRSVDRRGRALPWWTGCRTLAHGQLLLLGRAAESFDGRYFGPTMGADLIGRAVPLWVR